MPVYSNSTYGTKCPGYFLHKLKWLMFFHNSLLYILRGVYKQLYILALGKGIFPSLLVVTVGRAVCNKAL